MNQNNAPRIATALALVLFASAATAQGPPRRTEYRSECGSEISWLSSMSEARNQAQKQKRPILWFIPVADGSRMDRTQELYWYMMGGAFMDPLLVASINDHFVPLRFGFKGLFRRHKPAWLNGTSRADRKELAKEYGIKNLKFVEPGVLILDSSGKVVAQLDRLTTYNSQWMLGRLKKIADDNPELGTLVSQSSPSDPGLKAAHAALASGNAKEALPLFAALARKSPEAGYFQGVCLHMTRRTSEGDKAWARVAKRWSKNRWGWKSKIELDRWGPFIHGFEEYRNYPERAMQTPLAIDTRLPSTSENTSEMTSRAVNVLLALQRKNGGWDDSRYDFGGVDSLPNVHMAITALTALALLEWSSVAPGKVEAALKAADKFIWNEKNTNPDDDDEIIWAYTYRLMYLSRLLEVAPTRRAKIRKKMAEITRLTLRLQARTGAWAHEYANPFTTALTMHALQLSRQAKVLVPKKAMAQAASALARCRGEDGTFSYGQSRRKGGGAVEQAAGRMPLCELALMMEGKSSQEKLGKALGASFDWGEVQEAVRKYDDHADRWANGGFFFWFGVQMRGVALQSYQGADRKALMKKLRDLVYRIHEVDGGWIDSHELGKSYGTAMGLITLKSVLDPKP